MNNPYECSYCKGDLGHKPWCPSYPDDSHVNLIECHIHNVFEVMLPNPYQVCFECKHVYNTPQDLEAAYTDTVREMNKHREREEPFAPEYKPADKIYFCQECIHDF